MTLMQLSQQVAAKSSLTPSPIEEPIPVPYMLKPPWASVQLYAELFEDFEFSENSEFKILLIKPMEDIMRKVLRWMSRRLPQAVINRSEAHILDIRFCMFFPSEELITSQKPKNYDQPKPYGSEELWNCFGNRLNRGPNTISMDTPEGVMMRDRNMIDASSEGALMDKTPVTARHLISNMASNTQRLGTRGGAITSRVVSEVGVFDSLRLENQLTDLTSLVRQLAVGKRQQSTKHICGIHLNGAPNRDVPHFAGNRAGEHRMCWSNRWRIPVLEASISKLPLR
ncbi:hypothetical protein CR513_33674, partial [Mucuna pruriens]